MVWGLGHELGAPAFENPAMSRLFAALVRGWTWHNLEHQLLRTGERTGVLIARNWGDASVVNHTPPNLWSAMLHPSESFTDKFVESNLKTLEQRREHAMMVEDYFVPAKV
jgi:hypothetical protein